MKFSLIWLPAVLKEAGLKVALVDGWESRGRAEMGEVLGIICHQTEGPRRGNMPSLDTLIHGREDLPGPLSQLGLGRDGTFYIIAAGKCNHAGKGIWQGIINGNTNLIGIEAENSGRAEDFPWPDIQIDAYQRGIAAILKHIGKDASFCCGHKEYALPKGRKSDPNFNMAEFRNRIAQIMNGNVPAIVPIPAAETPKDGIAGRPTLRRGVNNNFVKQLQEKLGLAADGIFGADTEAAVREFQRIRSAVPDGIVGPKTWAALDLVKVA